MRGISGPAPVSSRRAQSSVIGVVMVISITILGVTGVLLFGASALLDAQTQSELDAAEHAMTQLDSRFSLSALGSSERQSATVDLERGATLRVEGDRGWMNVSVVNRTTGEVNDTILNTTLGAVSYEQDGTSIAYQGGGVWKRAPDGGSVMVSPPEFHYRTRSGEDPTLTLPLVVVRGSGTIAGEAGVEKAETVPMFPEPGNADRTNPLRGGEINVTVRSEYYRAWGAFFEGRTGGDVSYDHDRERVMISLVIPVDAPTLTGGVTASSAANELTVRKHAVLDSYNSTEDPYGAAPAGDNTTIVAAGDVTLEKDAKIDGDLEVGEVVTMEKDSEVTGNVSYGGSQSIDSRATVGGEVTSGADVDAPDAVDWIIDQKREEISDSPDGHSCIDSTTHRLDDSSCPSEYELDPGRYYLDEVDLDQKLVLDTNGGPIEVVVDGDFDVTGETVEVQGPGTVRFYVEGDFKPKNSDVTVPGDRAPGLWIYMNPGAEVEHWGQATFTGVVYGPADGAQSGVEINLKNSVEIHGGLVGSLPDDIDQQHQIHFDEALTSEDPLAGATGDRPSVTYLHVTVNRVNVSAR